MGLTGKFKFRKSLWGKIVLQLEEVKPVWSYTKPATLKKRWRDATLMDLAAPEMRHLIDMRFRSRPDFQSSVTPPAAAPGERDEAPAQSGIPAPLPNAEAHRLGPEGQAHRSFL